MGEEVQVNVNVFSLVATEEQQVHSAMYVRRKGNRSFELRRLPLTQPHVLPSPRTHCPPQQHTQPPCCTCVWGAHRPGPDYSCALMRRAQRALRCALESNGSWTHLGGTVQHCPDGCLSLHQVGHTRRGEVRLECHIEKGLQKASAGSDILLTRRSEGVPQGS